MSKLRVIQERTKVNEDEQDLRGLGTSTILTKTDIEPHLNFMFNGSNAKLHETLHKYECKVAHLTDGQVQVVVNKSHPNYKVNCMQLFNLGLHMLHHKLVHTAELGETNWLHVELRNALVEKGSATSSAKVAKNTQKGLSVTPVFSHALHQAGYKISPSLEVTFLNEASVTEILKHLQHSSTAKVRNLRSA